MAPLLPVNRCSKNCIPSLYQVTVPTPSARPLLHSPSQLVVTLLNGAPRALTIGALATTLHVDVLRLAAAGGAGSALTEPVDVATCAGSIELFTADAVCSAAFWYSRPVQCTTFCSQ